jgi:hypothetical protein
MFSIFFDASSLVNLKYPATSKVRSKSRELLTSKILSDNPDLSSLGLISKAGESIHPFSVKIKPWFLK